MDFGDNTISPLEIPDARDAAYEASKRQRSVEEAIREASRKLAEAERQYRLKLTTHILHLHAQDGVAWTACGEMARGEPAIANLRYERDVAKGVLEAAQQQAFRYGADRRDLDTLLNWSMRRDLRVDTEPADWSKQPTAGRGVPNGVDPRTGEVRPRAAA